MTVVHEIRIAAIDGLTVPDGLTEGSRFTVTCELYVSKIDQDWLDVTEVAGEPKQLPGGITLCTVATEWTSP